MINSDNQKCIEHRIELVNEAVRGETKLDTLPDDTVMPLSGEAEAMYFKSVRDFFKTTYAKKIMKTNEEQFR